MMTVYELIEALMEFPPDMTVVVQDASQYIKDSYDTVTSVTIEPLKPRAITHIFDLPSDADASSNVPCVVVR